MPSALLRQLILPIFIILITSTLPALAMQPDPDLDPPGLNLDDVEELTIDVSKKVDFKDGKIVQQDRDPFNLEDWPKCAVSCFILIDTQPAPQAN